MSPDGTRRFRQGNRGSSGAARNDRVVEPFSEFRLGGPGVLACPPQARRTHTQPGFLVSQHPVIACATRPGRSAGSRNGTAIAPSDAEKPPMPW